MSNQLLVAICVAEFVVFTPILIWCLLRLRRYAREAENRARRRARAFATANKAWSETVRKERP